MNKPTKRNPPDNTAPRPVREIAGEENDFELSQHDMPIDDPGDAQRSSKLDGEGDGEEELR
ncbi:hypothetical protein BH11PSE14_BH11PSE14_23580 [soil metagenome]